jgi:hypothetical protein
MKIGYVISEGLTLASFSLWRLWCLGCAVLAQRTAATMDSLQPVVFRLLHLQLDPRVHCSDPSVGVVSPSYGNNCLQAVRAKPRKQSRYCRC